MSERICANCNRGPFPGNVELWPEVVGYARPRSQRSTGTGSSIVARRHTGRWICAHCASRIVNGISTAQESML